MSKEFTAKFGNPMRLEREAAFGIMIIAGLLAFEVFNYSTTEFALNDLLGNLKFAGLRWSTVLAVAFCGIDFAGIARIFTPEHGKQGHQEVWYLFGAWLLAATMNAILTWWGVSIAILSNESLGNAVIDKPTLLKAVPVFLSFLVWLSRILLIGTFAMAGESLLHRTPGGRRSAYQIRPEVIRRSNSSLRASGRKEHAESSQPQATEVDRGQDRFRRAVWGARRVR